MTVDELVLLARAGGLTAVQPQVVDPAMWDFRGPESVTGYIVRLRDGDPDRILRTHDHLVDEFGIPPLPIAWPPRKNRVSKFLDAVKRIRSSYV